jgi:hypothetical protein
MRVKWMHLAAIVIALSFSAGCVRVRPQETPPAQLRTPAAQAAPSPTAPAGELLALVQAFEEAYNRHDVDETAGWFDVDGCIAWGDRGQCGYWLTELLRYDAALHRQIELSDCRVEQGSVICNAVQRDDCLAAGGLGATHYTPVLFHFADGSIDLVQGTKTPEDAQRDLLFLYALAGWAHRNRPAEWEQAGRGDLFDNIWYAPPFVDRTGAVMAALCREYAASGAAATAPSPTLAPRPAPPAGGPPGRVLFIGDKFSLGLDALLPKLAASGQPPAAVASQLDWYPSAALGVHYELGSALDDIRQGGWDAVVLEDDLQADWPARAGEFAEYGRRFDEAIRQAGAETVFTMVQPYQNAPEATTTEIAATYGKVGQELGARVAPVGLAFRRAQQERPDLNLYAADRKHPSWAGIYLAGCVLYATLYDRSPVGLTYRMQGAPLHDWQVSDAERTMLWRLLGANFPGATWEISERDAADLQRIAWETVQAGRRS